MIGTNDAQSLQLETNNSPAMTILSGGNVGIGTATPGSPLHVRTNVNGGGQIHLENDSAGTFASSRVRIENDSNRQLDLYVTGSGNTNEGADLAIVQSSTSQGLALKAQFAGTPVKIYAGGSGASDEKMRILSSGYVGIGTTVPASALDVNGALTTRGMSVPATSPAGQGRIYFDSTANKFKVSENNGAYVDLVGSGGGSGDIVNGGNTTGSTVVIGTNDAQSLQLETNNSPAMTILSGGNVGIGTATPGRLLHVEGPIRVAASALPGTPAAGDIAIDSGDGNKLKYYNGSGWQTLGVAGSGLSSLNGETGGTQSFGAPGTSGTAPAWSSSSNVHTLNIPMASAAGVTAGLLSKTDYDSFSGKLSAVAGSSLADTNIWVGNGSGQAAAVAMSGDATLANDGTLTLATSGVSASTYGSATQVPVFAVDAKGRVTSVTNTTITGTSPVGSSLTDTQFWVGNGSGQAAAVAMSGDATLANDGTLTLATSGATAGTYKSVTVDAKGRVTAGTNPTTLSGYGITDAVQNLGGVATMAAGADASKPLAGNSGAVYLATDTQKIYRDNGATWDEIANVSAGGSGDIVNGGNTTGSTVVIGTNDAQSLQLETDNSPAMTILSGGNVGIGTSAPVSTLQVNGGGTFNMPNDSQYFEIKRPTGTSPVFRTSVDSGIAIAQIASASSNPTDAVTIIANRSRGTVSAPTNPETNDVLFSLSAKSGSLPAAKINFVTDGTPTTTVPTRMEFQVADGSSAPMTKMTLLANGNLGIGTASPSEKLHIWGNLRVQGTTDCILGNGSGGTNCTSDRRLKTNISPIASSLEKISKLNGVEFDWNEKSISPGRHDIGVIAQEVQEQFPTAVKEDIDSGFLRVDYAVLVAPLIEAVKELASWLSEHDERLEALEAENAMLKGYLCEKDPNAPMCD